ncbi:PAS domain-containing protein [Vibrio algarum]|uniref:PAS domain-containing protein n=1 Tax=Vibrio algarum TaxID=3020714 RepID=A0ABT4YWB1_9VIBR|nr:PAS domain-containing protein [Vibrio sp. KJ40-1]MDB1125672.1 PAS domain-containing protein [Vibrio sp. KJ40-1]
MVAEAREKLINNGSHCMDMNNRQNAVQSLDLSGSIIDVNPAWLKLTGYKKEDVLGRHFVEFLHPDSLLCVDNHFPQLKDFGYVNDVQLKIRTKKNEILSVSLNGTSKYSSNGTFERTFCELSLNSSSCATTTEVLA